MGNEVLLMKTKGRERKGDEKGKRNRGKGGDGKLEGGYKGNVLPSFSSFLHF